MRRTLHYTHKSNGVSITSREMGMNTGFVMIPASKLREVVCELAIAAERCGVDISDIVSPSIGTSNGSGKYELL